MRLLSHLAAPLRAVPVIVELCRPSIHNGNPDGYELFVQDRRLSNAGKDCNPCIRITFHQADGKDLCRVSVAPGPHPVFVKDGQFEHLFIRSGNSTRLLTTKEAIEYVRSHWKAG